MKPSYSGFEAKKRVGYLTLPPVGVYEAEIQDVRYREADGEKYFRNTIELMIEITEGEYKNRYHEVYKSQDERFGKADYKGVFRLYPPTKDDEEWRRTVFESNLWAVGQSNGFKPNGDPIYQWDWDEKKLKGKKVGINVRKYLYTYNDQDRETTEIGQLESLKEMKNGKVNPMKPRDKRKNKDDESSTDGSGFTDVSKDDEIKVPWP